MNFSSENLNHSLVTMLTFVLYFPFLLGANYFSQDTLVLQILCLIFFMFYLFVYFLLAPKDFFSKK